MRVLLDEGVPRGLRAELPGHEVKTVAEAGWAGAKNGTLLQLAATQFDVLAHCRSQPRVSAELFGPYDRCDRC